MKRICDFATILLIGFVAINFSACENISPACREAFLTRCISLAKPPRNPTATQCVNFLQDLTERIDCIAAACPRECTDHPQLCQEAIRGSAVIASNLELTLSNADAEQLFANVFDSPPLETLLSDDGRVPPEFEQECLYICTMQQRCRRTRPSVAIPYPPLCAERWQCAK